MTANTCRTVCRVYEAEIPQRPQWTFSLMVPESAETALREEITAGRRLFRLGRVLLETRDENIARRMADVTYQPMQ